MANPDNYTLAYNQPRSLTVLTNDVDRAGAPANLTNVTAPTIVAQPTKGTLTVNANRTITYTPNPGSAGPDSFIYQLCDVVNPSLCDTARVTHQRGQCSRPWPTPTATHWPTISPGA